jgi:hypothetical protein
MFATLARTAGFTLTAALLLAAGGGVLGPSMAKAQSGPRARKSQDRVRCPTTRRPWRRARRSPTSTASPTGPRVRGDGPASVALNPKPADWSSKQAQDDTDGELF